MSNRKIVLIVDDKQMNIDILSDMLSDDYNILEANNGEEALRIISKYADRISVVLLDIIMPRKNGVQVLLDLNITELIKDIPIIMISGEEDSNVKKRCFELGAADYITKPFDGDLIRARVSNLSDLYEYKSKLELKIKDQLELLKQRSDNTIELIGDIVEARNLESGTHIKRVKHATKIIANEVLRLNPYIDLNEEKISTIVSASSLHDIGKIMISDTVLLKPGKLTNEEFEEIKKHTLYGAQMMEKSKNLFDEDFYTIAYNICRHHHEKYDGKGYPDGLAGDDIPLEAQIVSLADIYDALTNERVYKKAFTPEKAYEMINGGECGCFSEMMLLCFNNCKDELFELAKGN